MESTYSSAGGGGSHHPNLPPGFRFHPTDEELVVHYLKRKVSSSTLPVSIIAEVDLYKHDPWELPAKATFGEHVWYFFSPRERKFPNGARPNRAAISGYWKATGSDKPVMTSNGTQKAGVKKALVFYSGKPPKGVKTNWIMHEYRLVDNKTYSRPPVLMIGSYAGSIKRTTQIRAWIMKVPMETLVMDEMGLSSALIPSFNDDVDNSLGSKLYHPNKISSTFNTTSMVDKEHASSQRGLIGTSSNALSMSQSAFQSLSNAATTANSFSFKSPLSYQHLYWLNGEQDLAAMRNGPSSPYSSKRIPHHVLQGDSTISSAFVSLHNETLQVPYS